MQTNWDALERDNQAHRIAQLERDLSAALEREAKLRKHAEAMAVRGSNTKNNDINSWLALQVAVDAYRADFPREGA